MFRYSINYKGIIIVSLFFIIMGILLLIGIVKPGNRRDALVQEGIDFTMSGSRPTEVIVSPTPTVTPTPTSVITNTPVPTQTPVNPGGAVTIINCTNCSLAPVDKSNALPSTYTPAVVATGLSGGGYLTQEAKNQLTLLFNNAATQGISITILSSYRSYATQQSTFEYWVQQEMNAGYSRADAEARANTYSARPGHSEHQLGTTADLRCSTCASFDNSAGNLALYEFLRMHGHEYGFAISYPAGKEHLTGYVAEAWHVRYIGVSLGTELFNRNYLSTGNSEYLTAFLREKGLY